LSFRNSSTSSEVDLNDVIGLQQNRKYVVPPRDQPPFKQLIPFVSKFPSLNTIPKQEYQSSTVPEA